MNEHAANPTNKSYKVRSDAQYPREASCQNPSSQQNHLGPKIDVITSFVAIDQWFFFLLERPHNHLHLAALHRFAGSTNYSPLPLPLLMSRVLFLETYVVLKLLSKINIALDFIVNRPVYLN